MNQKQFGHIGISFRSATVQILNDMVIPQEKLAERLCAIREGMNWDELMLVSTCNRIEFYYTDEEGSEPGLSLFLSLWNPVAPQSVIGQFEITSGEETVRHLMRVAASVESMVIGETQILKQIKDAHHEAAKIGLAGRNLNFLVRSVIQASKRVYSETDIATNPVSVASMTYRNILDFTCGQCRLTFVGAGEVIQSMVPYFSKHGHFKFHFVNRTESKAKSLADRFGGTSESLDSFRQNPSDFDCLVSCTSADSFILTSTLFNQIAHLFGNHSRLLIDLANPKDIDPAIESSSIVKLVNLEDIEGLALENNKNRLTEIKKVDAIISDEADLFFRMMKERNIDLLFSDLPGEVETIKQKAIEKILKTRLKHLNEDDQAIVREFADYLSGKFIQVPLISAKKILLDRIGTE